ncbi:MAG: hypothetical protein ACN4GK_07185 [Acidimicrobiia bacterium]
MPDASTVQANVVAAVSADSGDHLGAVLDAVSAQVYEPSRVIVVGDAPAARSAAEGRGIDWYPNLRSLLDDLDREVSHVWLLHDDARPRPDALGALVTESIRVDASMAGSKLLDMDHPETLESVGGATDVFGIPYTGLDEGEVDQEQYDVVRDVAFTPGASVLVRRDLLRGLGGPDRLLPPFEAGIDFSQRARVAGGRVVVVPSSEVLHAPSCRDSAPRWHARAGRIRSSLKSYSLLTLVWLIPVGAIVDVLDAVVRLAIGPRLSIVEVLRSWWWNLIKLPSTLSARRVVVRSRQQGDAELFRYQVRGSSLLKLLGDDVTDAVRGEGAEGRTAPMADMMQRGRQIWQQPGFIVGIVGVALVLIAARAIVFGRLPATGYSLHLPESALDTLMAYAGGWNPAELGNPRPLHPSVGLSAFAQLILLGRPALTEMVLTVGGAALTFVGTSRLMRLFGIGTGGRLISGLVAVAGPATLALTEAGFWPGIPALAALPFALANSLLPWPDGSMKRIRRLARDSLPIFILAAFAPLALPVPLLFAILWWAFGDERRWTTPLRAAGATMLAMPALAPWLVFIDFDFLLESGRSHYWNPPLWTVIAFGISLLIPLLVGERTAATVAGVGGLLVGIGAVAARTADVGGGFEPSVAGLIVAAIGLALVAGAAVDAGRRLASHQVWRRVLAAPGLVGGVALAGTLVFVLSDGALGLGQDEFHQPLEFTTARQADHGPDRVLVIGVPEELPGDVRSVGDISYRVFQAPEPTALESRLHPALAGDLALGAALADLAQGQSLRPGEQLAPFGIRWVVFVGPSPLEEALSSKLDVKPLPLVDFYGVYENLVLSPLATEVGGEPWTADGDGFTGTPMSGRVRIAVNVDSGWQPEPAAADWAVTVSATDGRAEYQPDSAKAIYAWVAGGLLVLLIILALPGRKERR